MSKKKKSLLQELMEIQEDTIKRAVNESSIYIVENRKSKSGKPRRNDKARNKGKK